MAPPPPTAPAQGRLEAWGIKGWTDPRIPFAAILTLYCLLGLGWLGMNRSPGQMALIVGAGSALDMALGWFVHRRLVLPLSAYISCCSLALLLNYSHTYRHLFLPVLLAIGSKHLLTFGGKHVFNPSMFGVAVSLLATDELITAAPAYQWAGGTWFFSAFVVMAGLSLFVFKIGRGWLIGSFLLFYAAQTGIRAWFMRHHIPPEMLFWGTVASPPFFIFTFYMITDPATSPSEPRKQVALAAALCAVDLWLHTRESVFTFFYAALFCATARFVWLHAGALLREGPRAWLRAATSPVRRRALLAVGACLLLQLALSRATAGPGQVDPDPQLRFTRLEAAHTGITGEGGEVLEQVDPRALHMAKWILSVGDALAVGDVDLDGLPDLFFTNLIKRAADRNALWRNLGGLRFERVPLPEVACHASPEGLRAHGTAAGATFCDWDGDGDLDLALAMGFGKTRLLENRLRPEGRLAFVDATAALGVDEHTVSLALLFADFDRDARLDLLITNALSPWLPDYETPTPLNFFALPQPAWEGDRRMFHFMHDGWHDAANGGPTVLYRGGPDGRFQRVGLPRQGSAEAGFRETRWTTAATTADLNRDGWTDLYLANDFGPDEPYLNEQGRGFRRVCGPMFGDVGCDTYKGMNASTADFDRNGWLDIHVSNVHHALQAEGTLLWMNYPSGDPARLDLRDEATARGALNERRFGWGAAAGDVDLDGWPDLVQANGMINDRHDRLMNPPDMALPGALKWMVRDQRDYWYVSHKLMSSDPALHAYLDQWGDMRGRVVYPDELPRVYVNLGARGMPGFADVAERVGVATRGCTRGVALVDLDLDGDLDLVMCDQFAAPALWRNELRQPGRPDPARRFIGIELQGNGTTTHRAAIGTQVVVRDGTGEQLQELGTLGAFASGKDPRLLFGLGAFAGEEVEVTIRWYGGREQTLRLAPDRYHRVVQPAAVD